MIIWFIILDIFRTSATKKHALNTTVLTSCILGEHILYNRFQYFARGVQLPYVQVLRVVKARVPPRSCHVVQQCAIARRGQWQRASKDEVEEKNTAMRCAAIGNRNRRREKAKREEEREREREDSNRIGTSDSTMVPSATTNPQRNRQDQWQGWKKVPHWHLNERQRRRIHNASLHVTSTASSTTNAMAGTDAQKTSIMIDKRNSIELGRNYGKNRKSGRG